MIGPGRQARFRSLHGVRRTLIHMTPDQYVNTIITKYAVRRGLGSPAENFGAAVAGPLGRWAGGQLRALEYSGSYEKETGVTGISDVDVFISLKSDTNGSLKDLYFSLYSFAHNQGWSPRLQNVSVGVTVHGTRGDLVPGRVQSGYQNYHSLYLRKRDSWTQTNVALHNERVRNSGRLREIRAVKVWRMCHQLEFPSLYLELFTIEALAGRSSTTLSTNVLHVLSVVSASIQTRRIVDPANTNNVISDDLTAAEKQKLAQTAAASVKQPTWGQIIW
jgi:hypothetical protein